MATILGLDIPPGLEDLYFGLFAWYESLGVQTIGTKVLGVTRAKGKRLRFQSYIDYLAPIYNDLSGTQKNGWTIYWGFLPFSSHAGEGGYPGSGFSAFVYANAPRIKFGLPLLLDAPSGYAFSGNLRFNFRIFGYDVSNSFGGFEDEVIRTNNPSLLNPSIELTCYGGGVLLRDLSCKLDGVSGAPELITNGSFTSSLTGWDVISGPVEWANPGIKLYPGASVRQENFVLLSSTDYRVQFEYVPFG